MPRGASKAEAALRALQQVIREPAPEDPGRWFRMAPVPSELARQDFRGFRLYAYQHKAWDQALRSMTLDLRFEHLGEKKAEDALWRFVCAAHLGRRNLVAKFVAEHAEVPERRTCFFPLESLSVPRPVDLYGVSFIPGGSVDVPPPLVEWDDALRSASVVAAACEGTDFKLMAERAQARVEHALRLLRVALAYQRHGPRHLRFRLGSSLWFDDGRGSFSMPPDERVTLELSESVIDLAVDQEIATLPAVGRNEIERHANIALRWFERSQLERDAVVRMLYLFFALEAILGDRSEGLKAQGLAVRRAMLGVATSKQIAPPERIYDLYDEVRSEAVHGGQPRDVDNRAVDRFATDIRQAIYEFIRFARGEGITRRGRLLSALEHHERRREVEEWLHARDPVRWKGFESDVGA
jgi:hypothetical protein